MPNPDLGNPMPWRRSLRASQDRRAAAARRTRRLARSRGAVVAVVLGSSVLAGGAVAATSGGATAGARSARTPAASPVKAVQRALGLKADGVLGPQTRKAIRRYERAHGLKVDGRIGPALLGSLGIAAPAPSASAADAGSVGSVLEQLAQCESGGDPTVISPDGTYRGKYQFTRETWATLGDAGDPAAAPEAEQDRRAAALYADQGLKPWPACGGQISGQ